MECNRDEAARAKVIAEKKFEANDIKGAKRFALKAKSLYPELEGIQQMLSTLEVYIAAETKISGESDWYAILGVDPAAVEITIRKHYRKLALLLHPDKNKCIGAEGAFKLISESWTVLSDKAKRSAFDQKRKFQKTAPQKAPPPPPSNVPKPTPSPPSNVPKPTPSPRPNGFPNFTKSTCPNTNVHNKPSTNNRKGSSSNIPHPSSPPAPAPAPAPASTNNRKGSSSNIPHPSPPAPAPAPASAPSHMENTSFWTGCPSCLMQYEYLRVYLHHNLRCPNCQKPFYAKESNTAPCPIRVANQKKHFEHKNPKNSGNEVPFSGTGDGCGSSGSSQAASMVQKAYEQVKRKREEAQAEAEAKKKKNHTSRKTGGDSKRRKVNGDHEGAEAKKGIPELFKVYKASTTKGNQDNTDNHHGTMLSEKARLTIHSKLKDANPSHANISESIEKKDIIEKEPRRGETTKDVSYPHFYVFDNDRTEKCFGENEVWAIYDPDDGMPRRYAMITSVISINPFKVKLNWLKSKFYNEYDDNLHLMASGLKKTCGVYALDKLEDYNSLNSFSHKVKWTKKGNEGDIYIFPEKGDVWALYKNWSPEWDKLTSGEDIHSYDVVEVLEDYDENLGVTVLPLVKVAGFKTLFHYHLDPKEAIVIKKEDMSRFSHRVPCHLLRGQDEETPSYLKGCLELDPASTPLQLQVIIAKND